VSHSLAGILQELFGALWGLGGACWQPCRGLRGLLGAPQPLMDPAGACGGSYKGPAIRGGLWRSLSGALQGVWRDPAK